MLRRAVAVPEGERELAALPIAASPLLERSLGRTALERTPVGAPLVVQPPQITMERICKRYGAIEANVDVTLELRPGEMHALLGENGAGKSTLMSILFGLLRPDSGRILLDGEAAAFTSPADALRSGIGMVHQHFMLVPSLTVAENVAIGSVSSWDMLYRRRRVEAAVRDCASRCHLEVDPGALVRDLPVEEQQRVEILRLLYRGAQTLILDEPTAALGSAQVKVLLATLKDLQANGHSIVIVTHKLDEVMQIADRATILKGGRNAAVIDRADFDKRAFARAMFDELPEHNRPPRQVVSAGTAPRLILADLHVRSRSGRRAVEGFDLAVRPGEIVGLAGVAGNGQGEVVDAVAGIARGPGGRIELDGQDVSRMGPLERRRAGISVIPEDRHRAGLVLDMSVAENLALAMVPAGEASSHGFLRRAAIESHARELLDRFDIRPRDPARRVAGLSGGNQQKVVVARELAREPRLLIAASPTRGLDVSAAESIHRHIEQAAARGCGVLLVSADLDEILAIADRVAVVFKGRVILDVPRAQASSDVLGLAMIGHVESGAQTAVDSHAR